MDPILGSLLLVPFDFTPVDWAPCNGAMMSIQRNTALYSLIGIKFGGDGHTNFALPKLEAPAGCHWIIATTGVYPNRQ